MVPVADGGGEPGHFVQDLGVLPGVAQDLSHGGVLLKNDLALAAGVDFQGVALPNPHGPPDFFGDHDAAQVV